MSFNFFVYHTRLSFEEDAYNEFKAHRNFSIEEIPPWARIPGTNKPSCRPISRNVNAFLNTGNGGKIFLGIADDGEVEGLQLTPCQVNLLAGNAISKSFTQNNVHNNNRFFVFIERSCVVNI